MDKPMNGAEIARKIGITRQAVSYAIKRSMAKMYNYVLEQKWADSPFDAIIVLMKIFKINNSDIDDIYEFLTLFPNDIQKKVKNDALKQYGNRFQK